MKSAARFVVVARHGERLDYVIRDSGYNWTAQQAADRQHGRPYDPPLTDHGKEQAEKLGRHLAKELQRLAVPPISKIYTSPYLRCRQTSLSAQKGLSSCTEKINGYASLADEGPVVRVEYGLSESFNDQWFRSWALPGTDGTWGFQLNGSPDFDPATLHPWSKQPVQRLPLFQDWKTDTGLDLTYEPQTAIEVPFSFDPLHLETREQQCARMKAVIEKVSKDGECVMVTSHGAPVLHLFEELTGQPWTVHGKSVYCCYSIYKSVANEDGTTAWEPLAVNESSYLHEVLKGDNYMTAPTTETK